MMRTATCTTGSLSVALHLGIFGIHRFYLGKWLTGLLWLLTGGQLMLGVLYDYWTLTSSTCPRAGARDRATLTPPQPLRPSSTPPPQTAALKCCRATLRAERARRYRTRVNPEIEAAAKARRAPG